MLPWRSKPRSDHGPVRYSARGRSKRDRLRALEARIRRLETTVTVLSEIAGRSDVDAKVRKRLMQSELLDADEEEESVEGQDGALRGSVYRGASVVAASGTLLCAMCGRPLDPDDPEIMLADKRRACLSCSQRARR
jgi:hypothetical protein